MCIISGEIERVGDTKIIAAPVENGRQLIVYSNAVKKTNEQNPVAMILPYPNGHSNVEVIETEERDMAVFSSLKYCFTVSRNKGLSCNSTNINMVHKHLEVLRSGSYRYSVATNMDDLYRIDRSVFELEPELDILLKSYGDRGFGFIVCVIDKSAKYSPFAYITDMDVGKLFIPTKHFHRHSLSSSPVNEADWDHDIYIIGIKGESQCRSLNIISKTAFYGYNISSYDKPYSFSKYLTKAINPSYLSKFHIIGHRTPNMDIILDVGLSSPSSSSPPPDAPE